jgi:hypothetical protein
MRSRSVKRRLEHLEKEHRTADGVLHFADGSSRAVKISRRNHLSIFLDAMRFSWFRLPPGPGAPVGPKAKPTIKYEVAVRLIGGAERVETDDRFLRLTHGMCAEALEYERKALERNPKEESPGE